MRELCLDTTIYEGVALQLYSLRIISLLFLATIPIHELQYFIGTILSFHIILGKF